MGGQKPQKLPLSQTEEAKEIKEEKQPDRSGDYKAWFGQSKIVEDDEYSTLLGFFDDKGTGIKSMEMVYRGSDEGFEAYNFHEKCDDVGPTLILIQSEHSHVFGGFTTQSWKDETSQKSGQWRQDKDCFIFLL